MLMPEVVLIEEQQLVQSKNCSYTVVNGQQVNFSLAELAIVEINRLLGTSANDAQDVQRLKLFPALSYFILDHGQIEGYLLLDQNQKSKKTFQVVDFGDTTRLQNGGYETCLFISTIETLQTNGAKKLLAECPADQSHVIDFLVNVAVQANVHYTMQHVGTAFEIAYHL
jgi:hypothetical protein